MRQLTIGTRGSPLALAQAHDVQARLETAHPDLKEGGVKIEVITTSGDRIQDRALMAAGGKGLFTKEIEEALTAGTIDLAVHSTKDMPTQLPDGLVLDVYLTREDPRDVFISPVAKRFEDLPEGAVLGTASLRRRAQALRLRPDLDVRTFRGNVGTRLRKLEAGEAQATFLARAGLNRLGQADVVTETLDTKRFLPAPAQGIVSIECRAGDDYVREKLAPLHDPASEAMARAERAFLGALDGSCRTPIAALATVDGCEISLEGALLSVDGATSFDGTATSSFGDTHEMGRTLGEALRAEAGDSFFAQLIKDAEQVML